MSINDKAIFNNTDSGFFNVSIKPLIEEKKEAKRLGLDTSSIEKKASFDMKYNYFSSRYEQYLSENPNLTEEKLPFFYKITKNVSDSFESILNNITRYQIDKKYFFSSYSEIKKTNPSRNILPMYTNITFDNIFPKEFGFYDLFIKYNFLSDILKKYGNSNENIQQINPLDLSSDPFFLTDYSKILNKNKCLLTSSEVNVTADQTKEQKYQTYYDVIGYKISKYRGQNFLDPLQEWFIPCGRDAVLQFIDSQVRYNTNYLYKISYIFCFISTKLDNNDPKKNEPSLYISSLQATEYENRLLDAPPMYPIASFIPYIGVSNRVKILFQDSMGEFLLTPTEIYAGESRQIRAIKEAQNREDSDKILFKGDDSFKIFQILRLTKKPKQYSDFQTADVFDLLENVTSYEDSIKENTTYYYTFRSMDNHGHVSNPSKVYSLTIVNDNGTIYPLINIIDLDEENMEDKQPNKKIKRFLGLAPRINHLLYDDNLNTGLSAYSGDAILENVKIGNLSPSIWGKKFKIRVTSVSSGKMIDLNLDFPTYKKKN